MKKYFYVLVLTLFCGSSARGQCSGYIMSSFFGQVETCVAGSNVYAGQIVSLTSNQQVVPVTAGSANGVFGVAIQTAHSGTGVPIVISGSTGVLVHNNCIAGNVIIVSSKTNGRGHCVALSSALQQWTGTAKASSSGFVSIQISPLSSKAVVGAGDISLSSPVMSPNPLAFDVNRQFKNPNPYVDVTTYGVRAVALGAPAIPGITANCTTTNPSVPISSASTFQNGDGVTLFGCGAAHSMSTPGAPTVTPSLAASGTGTGIVVNAPAGSTTYTYEIVARNTAGGLTAVGSAGSTSTGAASLGLHSVNIASLSKSGVVNTVTTASAHGLAAGAMVLVSGTTDDLDFGGWVVVSGSADNTHFTYNNGMDSNNGAHASSTGGTVQWWNCNHLTWTAVTGAFEYYIYGRTSGSLTLLGVSQPESTTGIGIVDDFWDDFGSTMMSSFSGPYFVPTSPPGSATANNLTTTISGGGGTTTLTLANAPSTSVTGATIVFDNAPNILAAANAVSSGGGTLFFPINVSGLYVTNSYLSLPNFIAISFAGSPYVNDTWQPGSAEKWYGNIVPQAGTAPQFTFEGEPAFIVGRASPGIYLGTHSANTFRGLSFDSVATNNGLLIVADQANNDTFQWDNFITSGLMGMAVNFRGVQNNASFFNQFDYTGWFAPQTPGSATPQFFCQYCGTITFNQTSLSGRGFAIPWASDVSFFRGRAQGIQSPFLIIGPNAQSSIVRISSMHLDTAPVPLLTNLYTGSPNGSAITLENSGYPSASFGTVTGTQTANLVAIQQLGTVGQNTGVLNLAGSTASTQGTGFGIKAFGTSTIGYGMPTPAAPTVVTGSHGSCSSSCVGGGTYFYAIIANDIYGLNSGISPCSASVTVDGTQTVKVSWTLLVGQVTTTRIRGTACNSLLAADTPGNGVTGSSYVDVAGGYFNAVSPAYNGASSISFGSKGITGQQLNLVGYVTVSGLPSASANPGAIIRVNDSTSITAEGQTCVGGSTNIALAFSNGSVWKCF